MPFVAAPLNTDRFVHSSAPPGPAVGVVIVQAPMPRPSYTTESSVRGAAPSIAPESLAGVEPEVAHGPSVRQTVLAALAGPALLAVAAGVVALVMSSSNDSDAVSRRPAVARESVSLKATSGDPTRSKAAPAPEKPERPHR